jgi:ammonia channel protein AmtB
VDAFIGLRVSEDEERIGLDLTQHRESGYTMLD